MSGERAGDSRGTPLTDGALWRRSRATDAAADEAEHFLDLAGFAEDRLDPDDEARVDELLARDPQAAADVEAARQLAALALPEMPPTLAARIVALVDGEDRGGTVVSLSRRRHAARVPGALSSAGGLARWASLAAAVAVASWLGFALGVSTSQSFARAGLQAAPATEDVLHELLDPSTGFVRDLTGGTQT